MVLWDTRAPTYLGFAFPGQAGDRQEQMRAAAVDALFSESGAGLQPGDQVAVFVQGVPGDSAVADALRSPATDPKRLYDALKPTLSTPTTFTVTPSDGRLDASRRLSSITLGFLEACDHCPDERSRGLRPDRAAGDYQPWLVTHHALAQAYVAHGRTATCGEPDEVFLLWVTTGDSTLDASAIDGRLREKYGEIARLWFRRLEGAYWREPVRDDRLTKLFRVHRAAADPARGAAQLAWRDADGGAAGIQRTAQWKRGPIGLDALPTPDWRVPVPTATVHHAAAWLDFGDGPAPVPVTWGEHEVALADPEALRTTLVDGLAARATTPGLLTPRLDATVWTLPAGADVFGYPSVAVLEPIAVPAPPIRVAWVPISTAQVAIGVAVALAGLTAIAALVWTRTRTRPVRASARWADDGPVDLLALKDAPTFSRVATLRIEDQSGFRPRNARLRVRVRLQSFLEPDVPLKDADFQSLTAAAPWRPDGDGFVLELPRADGRWLAKAPLTVTTRHPAIDYARVRSDRLGIVQVLRVTVEDATGRYFAREETLFHEVQLVSVPGPSAAVVRFDLAPGFATRFVEARVAGLDGAAFEGARVVDLGWLSIGNPIGGRWRPLPVAWTVPRAVAVATADDGTTARAEVRLRRADGDGIAGEVAAGERGEVVVTVVLPEAARDRPRWRVVVTLDVRVDDGTPEGRRTETLERAVRVRTTGRPRLMVVDLGTTASRVLLQDLDEARWGFLPFGDGPDGPAALGEDGDVGALAAAVAPRLGSAEVEVIRGSGRIAVRGGPRGEIVALIPNEAPPAWREAVLGALAAGPLGPADVLPIAEAEAAALWHASVRPERARVLLVDLGGETSGAALVDVDPSATRGAPVVPLATGAARRGANALGPALLDAIATVAGSPLRWATLDPAEAWAALPALDAAKRAMSDTDAVDVTVAGQRLRAPVTAILAQEAWVDAVDRLIVEAVAPALGRRPAPRDLSDVDQVVLTGRGSLTRGLATRVDAVLSTWGLRAGRVARPDREAAKAAGALGARLYGLGLAGAFVPAAARHPDRLVLVARVDGAIRAWELLAPGLAYDGGALVGPWVTVPRWEEARIWRTFRVVVDGAATAPWELDARRLRDRFVGEAADDGLPDVEEVPMPTPSFGHGPPEAPHAKLRVTVGPDGVVSVAFD